jgi:hypothetical protein
MMAASGAAFARLLIASCAAPRDGAGEQAHGSGHRHAAQFHNGNGQSCAEQHDRRGHQIQWQALTAQRGKEAGTDLHSDRINEKNEAELAGEFEDGRGNRGTEVSEGQTREKHPGDAEADPLDLEAADREPHSSDGGNDENGVGDAVAVDELDEPVHVCIDRVARAEGKRGLIGRM